jgi:hypothetical protein
VGTLLVLNSFTDKKMVFNFQEQNWKFCERLKVIRRCDSKVRLFQ